MSNPAPVERSFFGTGTRIEGTLEIDGDVKLEGHFRGKVVGTATITVGEQANVQANLYAPTVVVQGLVRGEIHARDRLELSRSAKVNGVLRAQRVKIEEGALFEGECRMSPAEAPKQAPRSEPRPAAAAPISSVSSTTPSSTPSSAPAPASSGSSQAPAAAPAKSTS
jgi:cytoskeletal protein CcmA (bactofilin family)